MLYISSDFFILNLFFFCTLHLQVMVESNEWSKNKEKSFFQNDQPHSYLKFIDSIIFYI